MLFTAPVFLFFFLPAFLALYFALRGRRNAVILAGSLFFYAWAEPRFIFWVLSSAVLDWWLSRLIAGAPRQSAKRAWLTTGITANLALLLWFKYANFLYGSLLAMCARAGIGPPPLAHIALPIAISFIVFEKITYLVDVYRRVANPANDIFSYLTYVFFFPKLLAGPIIRYHDIEPQFHTRAISWESMRSGIARFVLGMGKKVLIADYVSRISDQAFQLQPEQLDTCTAWLGVLCFTIQIYFDFSGYSDMAIGLGRMLGFRLRENFCNPYIAENFTDFWRRWHISLSNWIREYLYIPLGGNRKGSTRTYINLCTCFVLSGLWHGAAWHFVIWGAFHGMMLMADRLFWRDLQRHVPRPANVAITFFLVMMSWVVFRCDSFRQAENYFIALFVPGRSAPNLVWVSPDIALMLTMGLLISFAPLLPRFMQLQNVYGALRWRPLAELLACFPVFLIALAKVSVSSFQSFIYFRF
ncbi:MAG: MBOAT family protein [Verrucomicrobia bacterium]|nr:MBOAT family protein [Verrucomicrobiota bacterium]